jgi:hypothetical protein
MSNTAIQLKKSGITGNTPSSLAFGEVALNYADGKLYYKNSLGGTSYISNQYSFDTINSNNSLIFAGSGSDTLSFVAGNNITISTNTTTKTITINASISGGSDPGPAFDRANAAYNHANAAYDVANTGVPDSWARTQANNAYDKANSAGSFANGAFVTANSAGSFANGAFTEANTVHIIAQAAFDKANTGTTALDVNADIVAFTIAFS